MGAKEGFFYGRAGDGRRIDLVATDEDAILIAADEVTITEY